MRNASWNEKKLDAAEEQQCTRMRFENRSSPAVKCHIVDVLRQLTEDEARDEDFGRRSIAKRELPSTHNSICSPDVLLSMVHYAFTSFGIT